MWQNVGLTLNLALLASLELTRNHQAGSRTISYAVLFLRQQSKATNFLKKKWLLSGPPQHTMMQDVLPCLHSQKHTNGKGLTSRCWHSCKELVGRPIHLISFFSFEMMFIAISTFSASYTRRRMFLWSTACTHAYKHSRMHACMHAHTHTKAEG